MKVRVVNFHSVAHWRWNLNQNVKSNASSNNNNASASSATLGIVPTPLGGGNMHGSRQIEVVAAVDNKAEENDIDEKEEADEDDDCCPICRRYYDLSCPDCKHPGEDCPIMSGPNCRHSFHLHCIYKWITQQGPGEQHCPMCREPWEFDQ